MLVKDIKIYTIDQYICSIVNKELQGIYTGTGRVGSQYNHTIPYLKQSHSQLECQRIKCVISQIVIQESETFLRRVC